MKATTRSVTIRIHGLACGGGGALNVERTLKHRAGVERIYVNPLTETAHVEFDPSATNLGHLIEAIERAGFGAGQPSLR